MYKHKATGKQVLTARIAWAATQQLMGVVSGGTGTRAALSGREVAGKTGTAQNYQDAWFVGYTPQLVTAVWMGYSKGSIPMRNVHGQRAFGGTFCAPIWHTFMSAALKGKARCTSRAPRRPTTSGRRRGPRGQSHAAAGKPKPKPSRSRAKAEPPTSTPTTPTPVPAPDAPFRRCAESPALRPRTGAFCRAAGRRPRSDAPARCPRCRRPRRPGTRCGRGSGSSRACRTRCGRR